jgi:hypothetical protein
VSTTLFVAAGDFPPDPPECPHNSRTFKQRHWNDDCSGADMRLAAEVLDCLFISVGALLAVTALKRLASTHRGPRQMAEVVEGPPPVEPVNKSH